MFLLYFSFPCETLLMANSTEVEKALAADYEIVKCSASEFVEKSLKIETNQVIKDPALNGVYAFHSTVNIAELGKV